MYSNLTMVVYVLFPVSYCMLMVVFPELKKKNFLCTGYTCTLLHSRYVSLQETAYMPTLNAVRDKCETYEKIQCQSNIFQ